MKPVRIGIAGSKFAASFHTEVWQMLPGAEVVALAARNPDQRGAFQKKYGIPKGYENLEQLLSDPDVEVVDICLPNYLHAEAAIQAMEAGKDVICEKPFATRSRMGKKLWRFNRKQVDGYSMRRIGSSRPRSCGRNRSSRRAGSGNPSTLKERKPIMAPILPMLERSSTVAGAR